MIDKLDMLLALGREQHFGRAAESCGVTQPTLSAGLKSLEEGFGVLLVARQSRFIGFTPEGLRVLDWARRIVGDYRAMREEIHALKRGLAGHLRIAVVPTALPVVSVLTTPLHAGHPEVTFTILSRTSVDILNLLDNLEIDAGLTYIGNEPLGRARSVPLYQEQYQLLIAADRALGDRASVTWAEAASVPLCLLTPDMQNRRIIDRRFRDAGVEPAPTLVSNSIVVLYAHVRTGNWASVMPAAMAETMGLPAGVRAIPISDPTPPPVVGLVYPQREPLTPLTAALVAEARRAEPLLRARFGLSC